MVGDGMVAPDPVDAEHLPVLLAEVLAGLDVGANTHTIDGTVGGGGHTLALLKQSEPNGRVLGIDADPAAIRRVSQRLQSYLASGRLMLAQSNFENLASVAEEHGFTQADAILLDLGVSSYQLQTTERGFSFLHDGPLDMRLDPDSPVNAADIVNEWMEDELADTIYQYGEERRSRRIARAIVARRPVATTQQLAGIVENAIGGRRGARRHPATQTFQALRIAVNDELGQLERVLPQCLNVLRPGGRLAVIAFHSLEDRIVKRWMQSEASDIVLDRFHPRGGFDRTPTLKNMTRKPVTPSKAEIDANPRSRSAKLRIAERLAT